MGEFIVKNTLAILFVVSSTLAGSVACSDSGDLFVFARDCPPDPSQPVCQNYCADTDPSASWCDASANADAPDAGDAGAGTDMSDNNGNSLLPPCETGDDCPVVQGTEATCTRGDCSYACRDVFVDLDGDIDSNGCECRITDATDLCDGVDNDCDGEIDEDQPTIACSVTSGVCAGATTACAGGEQACEAVDYGNDFVDADDEDWRCDTLDNDCDGGADEACCPAGTDPTPVEFGTAAANYPIIVPGLDNLGGFIIAWADPMGVQLARVDEEGNTRRTGLLAALDVTGIDMVIEPTTSRLQVFVTSGEGPSTFVVITVNPVTLDELGRANLNSAQEEIVYPVATTTDTQTCVTTSQQGEGNQFFLILQCFAQGDPDNVKQVQPGVGPRRPLASIAKLGGDDLVYAWVQVEGADRVVLQTAAVGQTSIAPLGSAELPITEFAIGYPSALVVDGGNTYIVHIDGGNSGQLGLVRYDGSTLTKVGGGEPSLPAPPDILAGDLDGDGSNDSLLIAHRRNGNLALVRHDIASATNTDLGEFALAITGQPVRMAARGNKVGVVYDVDGGGIQFIPVNAAGDAICP
jgi:hypothetical protein